MLGLASVVAVVKRHTTDKPWWLDVVPPLLKYGISSLIGAYLVYWLTTNVSAQLKDMNEQMQKHGLATNRIADTMKTQSEDIASYQRVMIQLSEQTCENSAKLVQDRILCQDILRNWEKNK